MTVPASWLVCPLEQIATIHDDLREPVNSTERQTRIGSVPYYGATGQVGWIDDHRLDGEYILLGEDGAPFLDVTKPKAYRIQGKAWVNNHAHVLRGVDGLLLNRFLLHALNTVAYRRFVNGTTRLKLTQGAMRNIPVPLAPLAEQGRIVAAIDRCLEDLDAGVAALHRAKDNLDRYKASILQAAVTGRLTEEWRAKNPPTEDGKALLERILRERRQKWEQDQLATFKAKGKQPPKDWREKYEEPPSPDVSKLPNLPHGWAACRLHHLISRIDTGTSYRCLPRAAAPHEWGVVKVSAMSWGQFLEDEQKALPPEVVVDPATEIKAGDLLISRCNTEVLVGASVLVQSCRRRLLLSDKSLRLNPHSEIDRRWLYLVLSSRLARIQMSDMATGTKDSMRNISQDKLLSVCLPLPPLTEQRSIAEVASGLLWQIDRTGSDLEVLLTRSTLLRQSILKAAFEGRLVPQDPSDEPASELLARMKARQPASSTATKRTRSAKPRKVATK